MLGPHKFNPQVFVNNHELYTYGARLLLAVLSGVEYPFIATMTE